VIRSRMFDIAQQKFLVLQVVFFLIVGSFICIWLSDLDILEKECPRTTLRHNIDHERSETIPQFLMTSCS
ncbi:MAG: hypothetical protein Q8830_03690, partial [Candidatus Phytoplasma australasiaticum]|nr:hypothetical protein [Candidatus Phytoplasma australasiaticum]